MTIESPETYGEEYWSPYVAAQEAFEDKLEQGVKGFIPSLFSDPDIRSSIPFDVLPKLEGLFEFPKAGLSMIAGRFVSEVADQTVGMVMTPALRKTQYAANRLFANLIMPTDTAIAMKRRQVLTPDDFDYRFRAAGYGPFEQQLLYEAAAPFPGVLELLRWARYHGDPKNTWSTLVKHYDFDIKTYPKWEWLSRQQLTTEQITKLHRWGKLDEVSTGTKLQQVGWQDIDAAAVMETSYVIPNAMLLLQADLLQGANQETIETDLGKADIHPDYRKKYIDAVLTKPTSGDLVAYHLRQENNLVNLEGDLRKTGIHSDFLGVYETLAQQLPPIQDIITMAVREAFTPTVAARFGQYEDFPEPFGRYAAMQGLSEEWAERYWAAHWSLPSVTQGFQMLHRGIIDRADLTLLLKSQDVMPFWRDRLVDMAYRPLTRVDVRRMYKEGVLDERSVYEAYLELGYNEDNAERMTEFVVKQALSAMAKFSTTDVVKAFADRIIDKSEAGSLLRQLNVRGGDVNYILSYAEYKREWGLSKSKISAVRNLYRRGIYDVTQTNSELNRLGLPAAQTETLMEQWYYEQKAEAVSTFTKAETLRFVKNGMITEKEGRNELELMGYDQWHIDLYIKGLTWQKND